MPTEAESNAVREFVLQDAEYLDVAFVVYESWPRINEWVCQQFLKQLCARIKKSEALRAYSHDVRLDFCHSLDTRESWICLYRSSWAQYRSIAADYYSPSAGRRASIVLQAGFFGSSYSPGDWYIDVQTPLEFNDIVGTEKHRYRNLETELRTELGPSEDDASGEIHLWWRYCREDMRNWETLVPQLHRECQAHDDGEITRYFVDTFIEHAQRAIPVIDKIELQKPE